MDIVKMIIEFLSRRSLKEVSIFVILLLVVLAALILFKYLWIKIRKPKDHGMRLEQEDLLEHHMFNSLKTYLSYEIQNLYIAERLRSAIFKDFLIFNLTSIRHAFERFLKKGDLEKLTPGAYHTRMLECVNEIVRRYEAKALEENIPPIVIEKFNHWHSDRVKQMYEVINDVCGDDVYPNNTIKTKIIFDYIVVIVNWTIADAKKTLISLNGELNKVTYKGISVDPAYLNKH
jgi:hypothetical protein